MSEKNNSQKKDLKKEENSVDEMAELTKQIAIHEAKSAVYKVKLAKVVLEKGSKAAYKGLKHVYGKSKEAINNRKK